MALIECPDCGKQISENAATCIGCGRPMVEEMSLIVDDPPPPVQGESVKVVTTQATGKGWKGIQLGGALLFVGGLFLYVSNVWHPPAGASFMVSVGFLTMIVGSVGGWWNHG